VAGRDTAAVQVSRKFPNFASSSYAPWLSNGPTCRILNHSTNC
jgi:hypothetical protein